MKNEGVFLRLSTHPCHEHFPLLSLGQLSQLAKLMQRMELLIPKMLVDFEAEKAKVSNYLWVPWFFFEMTQNGSYIIHLIELNSSDIHNVFLLSYCKLIFLIINSGGL